MMLGYFPREAAADPEPFTGERMTSSVAGQIQIEHYHRYLHASSLCVGLDVLDVASGEGYGAAQLAQVARNVVGVEYAEYTVRRARMNFRRPNLAFLRADARALPLADACFDAVVSFETIEHFDRQDDFLAEVRRVLRPGGRFIVSTPDRDIYSPPGTPPNPYHVREYTRRDFEAALRRCFPHVAMLMQRAFAGSALLGDAGASAPSLVFERRGDRFEACETLPRAPYLIAIASDRVLPPLGSSLYIERGDVDTDAHALARQTAELTQRRAELAQRTMELAQRTAELAQRTAELAQRTAELAQRTTELAACREEVVRREQEAAVLTHRCETATALAEQAAADLEAAERERGRLDERSTALARELLATQASLRTFLRSYWPNFRRHFFGR
jgi:SAM-dependent methyltransferase